MGHAPLAPSAAHRWLVCPASVKESAQAVSSDTAASRDGTATHEVMALWLSEGAPPPVGKVCSNGLLVSPEMIEVARVAVDYVVGYVQGRQHTLMSEEPVKIGSFFSLPEGTCEGTCDVLAIVGSELLVADLKAGWQEVQAEENPQLLLYAIGAMEEMGWMWERVRLAIIQPRNGGVKEWILTKEELLARAEAMRPAVAAAVSEAPAYVPTEEGCRYCPAAGVCRALQAESLAIAKMEFDATSVTHLTPEELATLLAKADVIETAMKAVREHAMRLLQIGHEVPGWKLVEGRRNRVWKDEAAAVQTLTMLGYSADDIAPRKILSPAQTEKLLKDKKVMASLVETPSGKATLAPADDKRPALTPMGSIDTGNLLD